MTIFSYYIKTDPYGDFNKTDPYDARGIPTY